MEVLLGNPALTARVVVYLFATGAVLALTIGYKAPEYKIIKPWPQIGGVLLLLIGVELALRIAVEAFRDSVNSRAEAWILSDLQSVLLFLIIPLTLLALGKWRWPVVRSTPGRRMIYIAPLVIAVAALMNAMQFPPRIDGNHPMLFWVAGTTLSAAFAEELVFRVMLLSYLRAALNSPTAALLVSSAVFGLVHVDNYMAAHDSLGAVLRLTLAATALGLFLGVLWLRTRSLALVGGAHTLLNLRTMLGRASEVWPG